MSESVSQYIKQCLTCIRRGNRITKSFKGLLTRPVALQLVSIDYVGPRQVGGVIWQGLFSAH